MPEKTESDSQNWDEIFARKLKSLSISEIEDIIAKALSGSVDTDYKVEIKNIDFEPLKYTLLDDATEIRLIVRKKRDTKSVFSVKVDESTQ